MRKFTLFLTLMVAMVTSAFAQTAITSLDEINNENAYVFYSSRSPLCTNADGVIGSYWTASDMAQQGDKLDVTSAEQQFALLRTENTPAGKYYMYSVKSGKFIKGENVASDEPAAVITFVAQSDNKFQLKLDGTTVNVTWWSNNAAGIRLNNDASADEGNCLAIYVAEGEVDLSEAVAAVTSHEAANAKSVLAETIELADSYTIGEYFGQYSSTDADYATKLQAIKDFYAAISEETTGAEIYAKNEELKTLISSALVQNTELQEGNYEGRYFVFSNPMFTTQMGVYSDGTNAAWKTFDAADKSFYWSIEATESGFVLKNANDGKYMLGKSANETKWTMETTADGAETTFASCGNGQFFINNVRHMHAADHNNGTATEGRIVSWETNSSNSASAWNVIEMELPVLPEPEPEVPEVTELIDDTKEYYLEARYINGTESATGYLMIGNNSSSNYGTVKLGAEKAQAFKFTLVEDGNNKYYTLSTEVAEGTGNATKYIDCSHEYNVNGGSTGSNLILELENATSSNYVIKTANGYLKGSSIMNGTYSGYHVFSDEADKANALKWTLVDATVQAVAPVVVEKTPAEGAVVESLSEIVLTFDKKVTTTGVWKRIKVKPTGTNNTAAYCFDTDVTISEDGLTVTFPLTATVTTGGEYTIELEAGFFVSEDGASSEAFTYTFTVEEPAIFPAEGGIVAGEAAFVAEGASYDGEEFATISGEIVGQVYETANVKVAHTQKSSSNSKVQDGLVRWYKYDILTFTPMNNAKLTKIVFTGTTGNYQTELTARAGTVTLDKTAKTITWTGEATEALTLAADNGQVRFASAIVTYEINTGSSSVAAPTASVEAGTYYNAFDLKLTAAEGAKIYYVTDDSELSSKANVYEGAIKVGYGETTIKAFAVVDGVASSASTFKYNVAVAAPKFSLESGVYDAGEEGISVEITCDNENATILWMKPNTYYKDIKTQGREYKSAIGTYWNQTTLEAIAYVEVGDEKVWSEITTVTYNISSKNYYAVATGENEISGYYLIGTDSKLAAPLAGSYNYGYLLPKDIETEKGYVNELSYYAFNISKVYKETEEEATEETEEEATEETEEETTETVVTYNIKDYFGRYIYATKKSDGTFYNSFNVSTEEPAEGAEWEITFTEDGKANIKNTLSGMYISFSTKYNNFEQAAEAADIVIYETASAPYCTIAPASDATVESINTITFTCEKGLVLAEEVPTTVGVFFRTADWSVTNEYNADVTIVQGDENNITITFAEELTDEGEYYITIPEGLFVMEPNGWAATYFGDELHYTISTTEAPAEPAIEDVTPAAGIVENIEIIKITFNQLVQPFMPDGIYLTTADNKQIRLDVVYDLEVDGELKEPGETEIWLAQIDENNNIVPITDAGTYTLDVEELIVYINGIQPTFEGIYTWTIGETTGIEGVDAEDGEQVIYDLTGRRIKEITNAGIYVVNGKKVIVK